LSKVDIDIRAYLYQHILLSGGNTLFKGLPEKLTNEVKKLAPKHIKVKLHAPGNRKNSCWFGGSIITSLSSFKNMWVTRSVSFILLKYFRNIWRKEIKSFILKLFK
jgi:actin-related protein